MFIINLKKSVLVTYLGVIFGVISMYFAFSKMAFSDTDYMRYSLVFLVLAGVCDMFDGKVARMCKRSKEEKEFGIQIDSLADTVNFVCLPVVSTWNDKYISCCYLYILCYMWYFQIRIFQCSCWFR